MSKQPQNKQVASQRRTFLKGAVVTTAAVSGGALAANAVADQPTQEPKAKKLGYQETDHVREYYKLARF